MVAGPNFGCGSSREHAPQSIYRCGYRAIIAESFAEIFFGNSTGIGMPCVCGSKADVDALAAALEVDPKVVVTIDLKAMTVKYGEVSFTCTMPESAREALISARWDPIAELLEAGEAIESKAETLAYV